MQTITNEKWLAAVSGGVDKSIYVDSANGGSGGDGYSGDSFAAAVAAATTPAAPALACTPATQAADIASVYVPAQTAAMVEAAAPSLSGSLTVGAQQAATGCGEGVGAVKSLGAATATPIGRVASLVGCSVGALSQIFIRAK